MKIIDIQTVKTEIAEGKAILVDVREPGEFNGNHLSQAKNIPSTNYHKDLFLSDKDLKICLICHSGKRARTIAEKLLADDFEQVYVLDQHMGEFSTPTKIKGWTVDRQFRMTLGVLLAIFLILYFSEVKYAFIIPLILSTGLIITSIIDRCYMRMGIAMLPWNRNKKSEKH